MFTLVIGGGKAGKSRYAEALAVRQAKGPLIYVATLVPVGEGEHGAALVRRHRAQRAGLGFETIERPLDLAGIALPKDATVLLEDASNLMANNLFCAQGAGAAAVLPDILALRDACGDLVAVSLYGLRASGEYDAATNGYIRSLAGLNEQLKDAADAVVMLENGEVTVLKGQEPPVFLPQKPP
jgi:adenosylcobinamide kinase/adenosylcobinamide-phosphate guanylyltransferase